jgi:mannose/fructose/N-acetylgalactosamine-specific phosphotransferase system component IIC
MDYLCEILPSPLVLTIVQYMYNGNLIDSAAKNGDLETVKFLHSCVYHSQKCTRHAVHGALINQHYDVARYVQTNMPEWWRNGW